jgi:hypothetical protein
MSTVYFSHAEPLWDLGVFHNSIAIDSHCTDVNKMAFGIKLHDGHEDIKG